MNRRTAAENPKLHREGGGFPAKSETVPYNAGERIRNYEAECSWPMEAGYAEEPFPCGLTKRPEDDYCPEHMEVASAWSSTPLGWY